MSDTSPLEPAVSPLLDTDPDSINILIQDRINEIFNKKPILLTDNDLKDMISHYREQRNRFLVEAQEKLANPKPRRKKSEEKVKKVPLNLSEALSSLLDD